ncbi:MAG TPA: DUF3298 and DUF4163 domain-containing protein [Blastocatellia bacterium]|nr:DUF3298 and DUF4163 domain-containing protein [Blastocatellia bacterium]
MKHIPCLLALALFAISLQACGSKSAQGDANVQPAALNQSSPQPDSQQANETVVPAPSEFKEVFTGTIDDRHAVRMSLERNGANLSGSYFYERAGAFNSVMRTLDLKGRIDQDGNVTLAETTYKNGEEQKTGEFKGKLDGLSANGDVRLRFSGVWTGNDGKQMPFKLQQLRFDLGGLKINRLEEKKRDKTLGYEIETATPRLAGADSARVDNFNQAVGKLVAEVKGVFEETAKADAHDSASAVQNYNLSVSYEITDADKDFISLLFSFNSYLGGAHPNTNTKSFNYDLNRGSPVKLADLFTPGSNYLNVISGYSIGELKKIETTSQVESGAGPKIENFHSWNITPFGLQITFDAYQVGPYAVGPHEVVIPYSVLKPIIRPDGLLAQFAK